MKLFFPISASATIVPAAFRRLCVETVNETRFDATAPSSRLQAAVC